jgi:hypothetical protein
MDSTRTRECLDADVRRLRAVAGAADLDAPSGEHAAITLLRTVVDAVLGNRVTD